MSFALRCLTSRAIFEAVKDGLLEPDEGTIDTIHGQALHLGRLVEDLRLLAQAESGGLHLELETDSLDDLVSRAVDAARPRAEASGVDLVYRPPANSPWWIWTGPASRRSCPTFWTMPCNTHLLAGR